MRSAPFPMKVVHYGRACSELPTGTGLIEAQHGAGSLHSHRMAGSLGSLDLVLDRIQREREKQRAHFDALDNKAGLSVGFAALLITLAPELPVPYRLLVVSAALVAGGLGLCVVLAAPVPIAVCSKAA